MNINNSAIVEFLGAENVEILKEKVVELILDQIRLDIENSNEYLISPYQIQEILDDAIAEAEAEVKQALKEDLKSKLEKTIEDSHLFPKSCYA